ncbi:hypothetical protein [Demequina silvatica]|uniref:hypothetical protein n=1 Tax=Demequina silvatica TaxID=1638988 RepID=UPI0007818AC5|nr:hypothetical protein [Demequina silvatica]
MQFATAGFVVLLVLVGAAAVVRLVDPPEPPEQRLAAAIIAGDHEAVAALIGDGALTALEAGRPTEAVRLAIDGCDVDMFRRLTDAGARRSADAGRAAQDVALTTAIRRCPPPVVREVWRDTRTATPPLHLMVFAAVEGGPGAVRTLAHLGLPVESPIDEPGGVSPLEAAILAGRADVARSLIALGADPERRTADGTRLSHLLEALAGTAAGGGTGQGTQP